MIRSLCIGPRTLLNDCNHSATAFFWRSALPSLKIGYWPPKTSDELVRPREPIGQPYSESPGGHLRVGTRGSPHVHGLGSYSAITK